MDRWERVVALLIALQNTGVSIIHCLVHGIFKTIATEAASLT